jgi:uncharacterized phage-like protein YoqJ
MILGITGHRPGKLGSYSIPNPTYSFIVSESRRFIEEHKPEKIITGMALGYDQWLAELAIELNIPFIAALPFAGQELYWPQPSQEHYRALLAHAEQMVVVSIGGFASWKMQVRNQWIVDNSTNMLAAYDGSLGGTHNCLEYAKTKIKPIRIINPRDLTNAIA